MIKEKEIIVGLLSVLFPTIKIYLFGSRARGTHTPTSDIDLAVDIGRQLSLGELARVKNIIEALNIPHKVDIVDMHSAPKELLDLILKEGIVWKG